MTALAVGLPLGWEAHLLLLQLEHLPQTRALPPLREAALGQPLEVLLGLLHLEGQRDAHALGDVRLLSPLPERVVNGSITSGAEAAPKAKFSASARWRGINPGFSGEWSSTQLRCCIP